MLKYKRFQRNSDQKYKSGHLNWKLLQNIVKELEYNSETSYEIHNTKKVEVGELKC